MQLIPSDIQAAADKFLLALGGGKLRTFQRLDHDTVFAEPKGTAFPNQLVWAEHLKRWVSWEVWQSTLPKHLIVDESLRQKRTGPTTLEMLDIQEKRKEEIAAKARQTREARAKAREGLGGDSYGGKWKQEQIIYEGPRPVFGQTTPYKVKPRGKKAA